ncbi:MAG TPA: tetratricopeptide repeat protein [Pirellulales bacterium]|nr:tetratricopeptide repeat protein [Pirellulales bacterium]
MFRRAWQLQQTLAAVTAAACLLAAPRLQGSLRAFEVAGARDAQREPARLAPPPGVLVELSPLEARALAEAGDGRTDSRWLLTAVCAASGEQDEASIARLLRRVEAHCESFRRRFAGQDSDRERAEAALEYLYAEVLHGGYQAEATDLAAALDGRGYNCVSSTVLFNCLAETCGLSAAAVEAPGHVFSVVDSTDGPIEVETTCRNWFRAAALAGRVQRGGARRRLSAAGLAALVYYNRGVELLAKHRFADAIVANLKALRLDPENPAARSNWLAGLNNWALEHNAQGDHSAAVRLLRHGLRLTPEHRAFRVNFVAVHQQWIEALLAQQQDERALELLRQAQRDLPQETYFQAAAFEIDRRRAAGDGVSSSSAAQTWSVLLHAEPPQSPVGQ